MHMSIASAEDSEIPSQVQVLGEELQRLTAEVIARTVARNNESGLVLNDVVEGRFQRMGEISTAAVASWMAGASPEAAMEVGHEVWQIFGQLAAQRAAPLAEVTKRVCAGATRRGRRSARLPRGCRSLRRRWRRRSRCLKRHFG
jgi:hypothetical protein